MPHAEPHSAWGAEHQARAITWPQNSVADSWWQGLNFGHLLRALGDEDTAKQNPETVDSTIQSCIKDIEEDIERLHMLLVSILAARGTTPPEPGIQVYGVNDERPADRPEPW